MFTIRGLRPEDPLGGGGREIRPGVSTDRGACAETGRGLVGSGREWNLEGGGGLEGVRHPVILLGGGSLFGTGGSRRRGSFFVGAPLHGKPFEGASREGVARGLDGVGDPKMDRSNSPA